MDFNTNLAARAYGGIVPATKTEKPSAEAAFGKAADEFASVLEHGEATAKSAMLGTADPHSLVEALTQTELAVETAVSVRDKVVEAYQEILRMPV